MTPQQVAAACLASLPGIGPQRLRTMLEHHRPEQALSLLRSGALLAPPVERIMGSAGTHIRAAAQAVCESRMIERCRQHGVHVVLHGDDDYPVMLSADPAAPALLFVRGDLGVLAARRVGIVGTRAATAAGRATARELGRELAGQGVAVVSGLARGIDGAAHHGALETHGEGAPVAVVGSGPDVPYPKQHRRLWEQVAERGALLSEWPPGVQPDAWRFPQRNRILAALCEVLIVVESRASGGSLITVEEALQRDTVVMAVPGSTRQAASEGSNKLIADGATPVLSVDDVFVALGLHNRCVPASPAQSLGTDELAVVDAVSDGAAGLDDIVGVTSLSVPTVARLLVSLERSGWLRESDGWYEAARSRLAARVNISTQSVLFDEIQVSNRG